MEYLMNQSLNKTIYRLIAWPILFFGLFLPSFAAGFFLMIKVPDETVSVIIFVIIILLITTPAIKIIRNR